MRTANARITVALSVMAAVTVGGIVAGLVTGTVTGMTDARAADVPAVGDEAPDFTLKDAAGEDVALASFRDKSAVLIAFYPRDFTPG